MSLLLFHDAVRWERAGRSRQSGIPTIMPLVEFSLESIRLYYVFPGLNNFTPYRWMSFYSVRFLLKQKGGIKLRLFAFNNWTTLIVLPILPIVSPTDKVSNLISNFFSRRTRHANIACFVSTEFIHRSKGFQLIFVLRFMSWWQNVVEHILWGLERDNFLGRLVKRGLVFGHFERRLFKLQQRRKRRR